jgi:aminomethyltransferase
MGLKTPFHSRTSALCKSNRWIDWGGYSVVDTYEPSHESEYLAIRQSTGMIDVSALFKYRVRGRDAVPYVNRLITRDIRKCKVGQVCYTSMCDEDGKLTDEGPVLRYGENDFVFTMTRLLGRWLDEHAAGMDVTIEDESASVATLALQGPTSRDLLKQVCDADMDSLKFWYLTRAKIAGAEVDISRTGYTGDLGYELWLPAEAAERVWDVFMAEGKPFGIKPMGMLAMLTARVEAGLVMMEGDYISCHRAAIPSQKYSPFELGLGWTVKLDGEDFIGREALIEEKRKGSPRKLVGFQVDWDDYTRLHEAAGIKPELPLIPWGECERSSLRLDGKHIGWATSAVWSRMIKQYVGFGTIETAHAQIGKKLQMQIEVGDEDKLVSVTLVKLPFYDPPRKRA